MNNIHKLIATLVITITTFSSLNAQCFDDGHSPFAKQGWLSCNTSIGPIQERGKKHWILYDLGEKYTVDALYFWNHNVWGETAMGAKEIIIDYSLDKNEWNTVGPFTIDKAPGSWKYTGVEGPSLDHAVGRYFLITVLNAWDAESHCTGLAEIKFILGESVNTEDEDVTQTALTISPNPTSDYINVTLPNDKSIDNIIVYNSIGQIVMSLDIPSGNQLTTSISHLQNGMYHLHILNDGIIQTKSFVKVD